MSKETINIYLTKDERKQLDIIKQKYQLSLTTIVDILCFETYHTFLIYAPLKLDELTGSHLYKTGPHTSIKKPKLFKEETPLFRDIKSKTRFTTNCLKIYLYKDVKKYIESPTGIQEYWNKINTKMTITKDDWWNYNQHLRYERRSLKENKEYYKEQLEKMDNGKSY